MSYAGSVMMLEVRRSMDDYTIACIVNQHVWHEIEGRSEPAKGRDMLRISLDALRRSGAYLQVLVGNVDFSRLDRLHAAVGLPGCTVVTRPDTQPDSHVDACIVVLKSRWEQVVDVLEMPPGVANQARPTAKASSSQQQPAAAISCQQQAASSSQQPPPAAISSRQQPSYPATAASNGQK